MASGESVTPEVVEVLANALLDNIRTKTPSVVASFLQTLPEDAKNYLFPFTDKNRNHLTGKDPSEVWEMYPYPYLQMACEQGFIDVILLLLNVGVDPSLRTEKEGTALEAATKHYRLDIIQKLMDWDSTLVQDEDIAKDLLVVACSAGHQDLAEFWLKKLTSLKGELPCDKDFVADKDPLIAACKAGHHQLAAYFVERKVVAIDAETAFRTGQTMVPLLQLWCQEETDLDADEQSDDPSGNSIYVAEWSNRQLHFLDPEWLTTANENHFDTLVKINLSHNALRIIPEAILWGMPLVESLDLSHNKLSKLPGPSSLDRLRDVRLTHLKLSNNHLLHPVLEIFMLLLLEKLDLSYNNITSLNHKRFPSSLVTPAKGEIIWDCRNLRVLNLSHNQIKRIPQDISSAKSLEKLNVSNNALDGLPAPWDCPLMTLKASKNLISEVDDMHGHWSRSLQTLDLSNNKLTEIPWTICQLTGLTHLYLASNHITSMPVVDLWSIFSLKELSLAKNRLLYVRNSSPGLSPRISKRKSTPSLASKLNMKMLGHTPHQPKSSPDVLSSAAFYSPGSASPSADSVAFPEIFRDCLTMLNLSENQLQDVPPSICSLSCLQKLDLSGNTAIKMLPDGLARLKNLHTLNLSNLKINEPATVAAVLQEKGHHQTRNILEKLSERLLGCSPYRGMKLMLVGHEKCGKTSVLSCLTDTEADDDLGINISSWTLHDPAHVEKKFSIKKKLFTQKSTESDSSQIEIHFSTWDLKGGELNSIIHQSFFTPRALYLLVWDLRDGSEGIESLRPWLLNIQSRAPESSTIIVSTHLDRTKKKKQSLESIQQEIRSKYSSRDGFPDIAEIIGVTATGHSGEGISTLRQAIYRRALDMTFKKKWGSGGYTSVPLIGRMIPRTFTILKEIVANEGKRRRHSEPPLPPVLKEVELTNHIKKIPDNKIETGQDIEEAANFLSTCGSLVHFSDHLQGLTSLYFTDPLWLYNILYAVANIKDSYVREGRVHKNSLEDLFKASGFSEGHFEEYLQLLQRLEILLPLSKIEFLIPSRLPKEKPGQELAPVQSKNSALHVLERLYILPYTPPGFWSRLVSRVYVLLKKLGEESKPRDKGKSTKGLKKVKLKRTSRLNQSMRIGVKLSPTNIMYWQRGVSVQHHTGRILLKPIQTGPLEHDQERAASKPGICIRIQCQDGVFKPMGFMVDQVENLIKEWYPGLLEFDDFNGQPLVERLIPCPVCKQKSSETENPYSLTADTNTLDLSHHHFKITDLALAATVKGLENVVCPLHPQEGVPLTKLIPDLLLLDLPVRMLDKTVFDFDPHFSRSLGRGGFGEVFKAKFRNQDVAVKMLVKRSFFKSSTDSGVHLPGGKSCNTELNQESPASETEFSHSLSMWTRDDENVDVKSVFIMDGFSNLRSEVATMCKLEHPCIIQLIGISIHHLCFAMELAPLGDLVTYLRKEMDSQREAFLARGKIYQTLLDRVLTYKIALQVAHGVAYLHSKRIIYSDLKTDNILLYSLDTSIPVNIKLTDYGIARAIDLQGARGMAGPMGFCAPEIMRGRTFTEKVDWFSYGMLLYHLMTGAWPYEHLKTAIEVRTAVDSGVKPGFQFRDYCFVPMFPNLEGLMASCWRDNPLERLGGADVTTALENPSFTCLNNVINIDENEEITCLHCSSGEPYETSDRLWLWTGDGADRKCAKVYVKYFTVGDLFRKSVEGARVNCMIQVGQWELVGTKDGCIQLFGPPAVGPQQIIHQQDFKMDAEVLCFSYQPSEDDTAFQGHLFAGLADGRVAILNHKQKAETDDSQKRQGSDWVKSKTLTFEKMRCNCLELVPTRKELWIACGNKLRLVNTKVLLLEKVAIAVTQKPEQCIVGLAHHHDDLFCVIQRSSQVLQYSMSTQRLVRAMQCGNAMLTGGDILVSESSVDLAVVLEEQEDSEVESEDDEEQKEELSSDDSYSDPEFLFQETYFDIPPIQQSNTLPASRNVGATTSTLPHRSKLGNISGPLGVSRPFSAGDKVRRSSIPFPQARSVLVVKDTLWIGMSTGDTLLICVDPTKYDYKFGQVLAILRLFQQFGRKNGSVRQLLRAGKEHVVAWQQLRSRASTDSNDHQYQLLVWKAWGMQDIWEFERISQMLKEAEFLAK